jgi:hypothetical protein
VLASSGFAAASEAGMTSPTAALSPSMTDKVHKMQRIQQDRALHRVNGVAETCFHECVTDFSLTRNLRCVAHSAQYAPPAD